MLGTSEYKHTAKEYRTDGVEAGYAGRSRPLCFAFIDPLPKDMGDNIGDVAGWYREQVAMLDKPGEAAYRPVSFAKDVNREFHADEIINEADAALASSHH